MFGLVANGDLYLTALPDERAAFAAEGGAPFSPEMGGRTATMISYWRAPDRLGDEPGEFLTWAPRLRGGAGPRGGEADRTAEVEPPGRMIRTRGDPGALPPPLRGQGDRIWHRTVIPGRRRRARNPEPLTACNLAPPAFLDPGLRCAAPG